MKKYYLFLLVLIILLISMTASAQTDNLANDSVNFSIGIDNLAVMNTEDSSLELELEKAELIENNTESKQTTMEIYNNFKAEITINQKPSELNYNLLNNGISYKFELNYNSNGNREDVTTNFEPGESANEVVFENIDPGRSELIVTANFEPDETNAEWWNLPADGQNENMYEDVLLEITIEEVS